MIWPKRTTTWPPLGTSLLLGYIMGFHIHSIKISGRPLKVLHPMSPLRPSTAAYLGVFSAILATLFCPTSSLSISLSFHAITSMPYMIPPLPCLQGTCKIKMKITFQTGRTPSHFTNPVAAPVNRAKLLKCLLVTGRVHRALNNMLARSAILLLLISYGRQCGTEETCNASQREKCSDRPDERVNRYSRGNYRYSKFFVDCASFWCYCIRPAVGNVTKVLQTVVTVLFYKALCSSYMEHYFNNGKCKYFWHCSHRWSPGRGYSACVCGSTPSSLSSLIWRLTLWILVVDNICAR